MQRVALPLGAALILGQVHGELEVLCLGWLRSDAEVGWYAAAIRLLEPLMMLPAIAHVVLFPRLSSLSSQPEAHGRLTQARSST